MHFAQLNISILQGYATVDFLIVLLVFRLIKNDLYFNSLKGVIQKWLNQFKIPKWTMVNLEIAQSVAHG